MNSSDWHPEILPAEQAVLLPDLAQLPGSFILYGSTALALLAAGFGLGAALAIYGDHFNYLLPLKALTWFGEPALAGLPESIKASLTAAVSGFTHPDLLTATSPSIS